MWKIDTSIVTFCILISDQGSVALGSLDTNVVPSPGKPSLMMRLFHAGGTQKEMLISMFDEKENDTNKKKT